MARLCAVVRSAFGLLSGKSLPHKMTRRIFLILVAGIAIAGIETLFLRSVSLSGRYCSVRGNDNELKTRRDELNDLHRNLLSKGDGANTSLLIGGIVAVQSQSSVLRGLLAASHSALPDPSLSSSSLEGFQRAVSDDEKSVFFDLLRVIDDVTARHNITYFMTYGTMIGSFRHHDMTPWDDDADVAMPYKEKEAVWTMLNDLSDRGYVVNVTADTQFRFVGPRSRLYSPSWPWRWPYVDIDLYSENETHVWLYGAGKVYRYDKAIVFPLHKRPLGPISLNAPRDGLAHITLAYGDYASCSTGMRHKYGTGMEGVTLPCSVFNETYPFVHRSLTWDKKVMETLKLGSKILYSVIVDEPTESAGINPFNLSIA